MNTADIFFQAYSNFMLDILIILMWGWGILYSLAKVTKYKKMLLGAFGCLGMFLYHIYEGISQIPDTLLVVMPNFQDIVKVKSDIVTTWQNTGIADYNLSLVLLFQICIVAAIAGRFKAESEVANRQTEETDDIDSAVDNDLDHSTHYSSESEQHSRDLQSSDEYTSEEYDSGEVSEEYASEEYASGDVSEEYASANDSEEYASANDSEEYASASDPDSEEYIPVSDSEEYASGDYVSAEYAAEEASSAETASADYAQDKQYIEAYSESEVGQDTAENYVAIAYTQSQSSVAAEEADESFFDEEEDPLADDSEEIPPTHITSSSPIEGYDDDVARAQTVSSEAEVIIPTKPKRQRDFTMSSSIEELTGSSMNIPSGPDLDDDVEPTIACDMEDLVKEAEASGEIAIPQQPDFDDVEATVACDMKEIVQDPSFEDETFASLGDDAEEEKEETKEAGEDNRSLLRNLLPPGSNKRN
ncbi:hypothetical protein [Candidatus Uabimicrobium amorphum]|uniref:Uncharacterized protein n=1 Tax=Uabimicrobium amorphum TaxID=2596890 RepID=A0A5S9ILN5_UABAM|nr:hypothetical protein [Candidatus Uabimicrobium amorphum]BBM83830.1 hypothetical protein UABAM_02185 [Candidatus Uabimicrobium amorphum]